MKEGIPYIKMVGGIQYIAALDHYMSSKDDTPIGGNVSDYIYENQSCTVEDLIKHMLTHNSESFDSDQRNIATLIKHDIQDVRENPQTKYLDVQLFKPNGDFRDVPKFARRREIEEGDYLDVMTPARPLFEKHERKYDTIMVLSMCVRVVWTGGASYKAFDENKLS